MDGDVPESMKKKRILALDIGNLMSGTKYRGEMESRVKKIISAIRDDDSIILFVDEMHMLMGLGATGDGAQDAANLLKVRVF